MIGWFNLPKRAGLGGSSPKCQAEDFVGVEAAEFFGEAVAEAGSWEGDALGQFAWLGEFGDGVSGAEEPDLAVGEGQAEPGGCRFPPVAARVVTGTSRGSARQTISITDAWRIGGSFDLGGKHGGRGHLVEGCGELDAPVGQAGPGEVGVAGFVGVADVLQRDLRVRPRSPNR